VARPFVAWARLAGKAAPQAHAEVRRQLTPWRRGPDLAGVRGPGAWAALPGAEAEAWRRLWAEVDALLARGGAGK
jgi:hypothetical protein